MTTKECVICNAEFEAKGRSLNCSGECRRLYANKKAKEYRLKNGAEINVKRLIQRGSKAKPMREYPPKTCLHCDKTFQPSKCNWRVAIYCSVECKTDMRVKEDKRLRASKRPIIKCPVCGITAKPKKSDGTTCGKRECVDEWWLKKRQRTDDPNTHNVFLNRFRSLLLNYLERKGIRRESRGEKSVFDLLDYTKEQLLKHFESLFTDDITWDNYGKYGWSIEHIRPHASFNYDSTDHPDFKKCWALNNLEPMKAIENKTKGDKWDGVVNA